ncbi:hypothetical protein NUACC26_069620 [Scytonema sp. NUACC26]
MFRRSIHLNYPPHEDWGLGIRDWEFNPQSLIQNKLAWEAGFEPTNDGTTITLNSSAFTDKFVNKDYGQFAHPLPYQTWLLPREISGFRFISIQNLK